MKMTRLSPDELILLHRPILLCAALGAGVLLLLWAVFWNASQGEWVKAGAALLCTIVLMAPALWFAAERVDVRFDRSADLVTITTRRLSGTTQESYRLAQIERAMIQTHKGRDSGDGAHRVALVLAPGGADNRLALTTGYASGSATADLVARINGWLTGSSDQPNA